MVVIKDKNKKEVKRLLLTEWNEKPGIMRTSMEKFLTRQK
jgi:hypothetical protein